MYSEYPDFLSVEAAVLERRSECTLDSVLSIVCDIDDGPELVAPFAKP
jgi:hypothetical protein